MKGTLRISVLVPTMVLFGVGCKSQRDDGQVVWIGNADLPDYSQIVADFSNTFASDSLCHGIRIETHRFPDKPYWFLETYSNESQSFGSHNPEEGISWWMMRTENGKNDFAKVEGSDSTSAKAAHHVCFIIKGRGGQID